MDPHQSAYRTHHSTETALIKVKNDIMTDLDLNRVTFSVLLDLSAAFDTIDREILISRLSSRIGVRDVALDWFNSYLADWSTRVELWGKKSHPTQVCVGLPQGSVLGPLGYSRHHDVSHHCYADDTQLYISFDPKSPNGRIRAFKP